ncbi:MAG TPA: hypothetical protein VF395_02300, partial [Polyangiaceae bacterium]
MQKLDEFLLRNVEGYLFDDLETLKNAPQPEGRVGGAVVYPLLVTTFAGIELLGGLVGTNKYASHADPARFEYFWRTYLYPGDAVRAAAGKVLYKLARHGLAHAFVVKGNLLVGKGGRSERHLTRGPGDELYVDAALLAADLRAAYFDKI